MVIAGCDRLCQRYSAPIGRNPPAGLQSMAMTSDISLAAAAIRSADALLITAGAGMGVDSGLPDFRGNEGFWKAYPVVARLGLSFEDMGRG